MKHNNPCYTCTFNLVRQPIAWQRDQVIARLRMIPQKTLFGDSIRHYLNSAERSDVDIWEHCVQMVKDQIRDAPEGTAGILGEKLFIYFKHLTHEKK